jgi:hypothetical protein
MGVLPLTGCGKTRFDVRAISAAYLLPPLLLFVRLTRQHHAVAFFQRKKVSPTWQHPPSAGTLGDLLQDWRNLLDGKSPFLHGTSSSPMGWIVPQSSRSLQTEEPAALPAQGMSRAR